jgi:dipeptidyl aminopeptidase/acylaminoacyl peptidase
MQASCWLAARRGRVAGLSMAWPAALCAACLMSSCGSEDQVQSGQGQSLPSDPVLPDDISRNMATLALGTPIVFRSDRDEEGVTDLYLMALDGTGVRRVTEGGVFFFPEWSPKGDQIAFRRNLTGNNSEVGLVAPDGSSPVQLTEGEAAEAWYLPVHWSLDGQQLSYASRSGGALDVWVMPSTGGAPERLLANLEGHFNVAAWSWPDGSRIAYIDNEGPSNKDLWVVSATGASDPVNLTQGRVAAPEYPQWSPDGSKLAISAYALLPDGITIEGLEGGHGESLAGPHKQVFVVDVATQALTRVAKEPWEDDMPTWSPDGKSLLIASDRDGDYDIWLVPLDAPEEAINLIDDSDFPREDSMPDAYWGPR